MIIEWGNNNAKLTIVATDSYYKLFLSIIEKQVCDRGVYIQAVESRLKDTQSKMHSKCNEVIELKDLIHTMKLKSIMGWIRRVTGI